MVKYLSLLSHLVGSSVLLNVILLALRGGVGVRNVTLHLCRVCSAYYFQMFSLLLF